MNYKLIIFRKVKKMKKGSSVIAKALGFILIMTIICGIGYTALITSIAQIFFNEKANGSVIEVDGKKYGSELLAQEFSDETHMWGRVMNVTAFTNQNQEIKMYAAPSNLSPKSDALKEIVDKRVQMIQKENKNAEIDKIPVDLVTGSGSGLDPSISIAAARYQIPRIAEKNNITQKEVEKIIEQCTSHKIFGILGQETVHVLKVNLMLEGILKID